jgi:hypothetical protein
MFDLAFALILSLFSLLAFIKGFVKSVFSLVNWLLAALISYFLTPIVSEIFSEQYSYMVLHSVVGSVLFMISIIVLSIFTSGMSKTFLTVMPKSIDQSLGFAFGFSKGYLIVSLVFSIILTVYSSDFGMLSNKAEFKDGRVGPSWLIEAKSYKILDLGGKIWRPLIDKVAKLVTDPENIKDVADKLKDGATKELDDSLKNTGSNSQLNDLKKIHDLYNKIDDSVQKGYHKKEIEKMNRLIDTVQ